MSAQKTNGPKLWMLAFGASTLVLPACVSTEPAITTQYYSISGDTGTQIDQELRRKGPLQGHALASAAIKFDPVSVFQEDTDKGCIFKTAKFRVIANITLPKWRDRNKSQDRDLRRAWDGLAKYAKAHEETHVEIAEEFAKRLGKQLMSLPAEKNCEKLDRKAIQVVERISKSHDRAQKRFDRLEQKRLAQLFG